MKKYLIGFVFALLATVFMAAAESRVDTVNSPWPQWITNGLYVGTVASNPLQATDNKVTRMLGGSATIDFASSISVCTDSSAITVTGAQLGDPCFVGVPAVVANSNYMCYVSAADAVKVRHCANGATIDPASATFYVRVISNQ